MSTSVKSLPSDSEPDRDSRRLNATTKRTLHQSDRGENLVRCADLEELFEKLEI